MLPAGGPDVAESHSVVENHISRGTAPTPGEAACAGSDCGHDVGSSTAETATSPCQFDAFPPSPPQLPKGHLRHPGLDYNFL